MLAASEERKLLELQVTTATTTLTRLNEAAAEKDVQSAEIQATLQKIEAGGSAGFCTADLLKQVDDLLKQVGSAKIEVDAKAPQEAQLSTQLSLMQDSFEVEALQLLCDEASAKVQHSQ